MNNFSTADSITKKEVRTQPVSQPNKSNLYLFILQQLKLGKNPALIARELSIPKTSFQYHLNKLKDAGVINKIGYGVWEVVNEAILVKNEKCETTVRLTMNNQQANLSYFLPDSVRGHAFVFTLKVPEGLRNWNNEKREFFLSKRKLEFTCLTTFGGGQRITFKGRKIWLTNKSVIIYEKSSYLAETSSGAKSHAIHSFISLVKGIERLLHADFTERAGRQYRFKVSRQHYALVKNALAKQYDAEGKKLNVYSDQGLWFLIDNSFNLHEAETVHPETADADNKKVQDFFNSLKDQPLTTSFILEVMNGIQQNQLVFAQNMGSHIKAIRDLGQGVNELTARIEELKGFKRLDEGQRTLEVVTER